MRTRKSQNMVVYDYLASGGRLTHRKAMNRWGIARLAARINELRNEGVPIETRLITKGGSRYASYSLGEPSGKNTS